MALIYRSPERRAAARKRIAAEIAAAGGYDAWVAQFQTGELSLLSTAKAGLS